MPSASATGLLALRLTCSLAVRTFVAVWINVNSLEAFGASPPC